MARFVLFMRKSVDGIRNGVKTYNKKSIVCQSCNNTVHIKIRVVMKSLVTQEIKCAGCQKAAYSTVDPSTRTAFGQTGAELTGSPSLGTRITNSQNDGNRERWNYLGDGGRPTSYRSSISQAIKTQSQSQLTSRFGRESSGGISNESPRASYGDQNSTSSNDGTNEYFEDQYSNVGQYSIRSTRSSYGPARKPSLSHTNYGLEYCCGGGGGSRTSSSLTNCSNWVYATSVSGLSHAEQRPPSPSDSCSVEEKTLKENQYSVPVDLGGGENGQTFHISGRRGSASSTDLTTGRFESKRRSDNSSHLHSSAVEFEGEMHPGPTLVSGSDKSIRSSTSDKRAGKRSSMHRDALSRSHNQKIEQQDEQEQQREAEKINAKRRNSLSSDFEVAPTEEDVRRAQKIWNDAQKKNPSQDREYHLIQWARSTLRARANWEKSRYNHPFTRSVEQLQLRSGGGVESPMPLFYPDIDAARHCLPFVPQNMSPRMSLLSLQPPPTPVKEEPEGDSQDEQLDETYSPLYHSSGLSGTPPLRNTGQIPIVRSDETSTGQDEPSPTSVADKERLDGNIDKGKPSISRAGASKIGLSGYKNINKRCMKVFKTLTGKVLCVPVPTLPPSSSSLPAPPAPSPPSVSPIAQLQPVDNSTVEDISALGVEDHVLIEPRSFGVIHSFPTNEAPLRHVGNEIAASVGMMSNPLVEIQVQLSQDLFARGLA